MNTPRILVVCYSRSGTTLRLARNLAALLEADLDEIREPRDRAGWRGWVRSLYEASQRKHTTLSAPKLDPAEYDVVVIGTPVWSASVSSPVRTWIDANRAKLARVALFCTLGGRGARRALEQMEELAGVVPEATLAVRADELLRTGDELPKVRDFAARIHDAAERTAAKAAAAPPNGAAAHPHR